MQTEPDSNQAHDSSFDELNASLAYSTSEAESITQTHIIDGNMHVDMKTTQQEDSAAEERGRTKIAHNRSHEV